MVKRPSIFVWDKYAKIEIIFFVLIWLVFPMISDLEYSFNEEPDKLRTSYFKVAIVQRIVWGIYAIPPYYLFYKLAIQQLLVKKRYGYFLLALAAYLPLQELYIVYVKYWSISHMHFLPGNMAKDAARWMNQHWHLHFTIHYLLLELLELAALGYYVHFDKQDKQIRELKQLQTETDLQYLKTQLQPHFFFNTLNNIYSLALQQSQQTAPMVAKLSSLMRYVLYEAVQPTVPLVDEIAFIRHYIDIQSVRYHENIQIRFDTQGITDTALIEPLLLLPFIENAIKHGIEEEQGAGYIEIVLHLHDQELTLSVKNSKASTIPNPSSRTGIGIENVRKRLSLLYPGQHALQLQETDATYAVLLTLFLH